MNYLKLIFFCHGEQTFFQNFKLETKNLYQINQLIDQPTSQLINLKLINQSIVLSINQLNNQLIIQSLNQLIIHSLIIQSVQSFNESFHQLSK